MAAEQYPRDVPPVWMLLAVMAMVLLHMLWPVARVLPDGWRFVGLIPIAAGGWLAAGSLARFRRAGTGVRPFSHVRELVVTGPFRRTRNPMYLALVLIAFGIALLFGTLSPLVVPPLLFLVLDRRFVRREERFLRACIGSAYDEYCARVRRWL